MQKIKSALGFAFAVVGRSPLLLVAHCNVNKFRAVTLLIVAVVGLGCGCARNPVSGKQEFVLMSEQQEIALGQRTHAELLQQYPLTQDVALQQYVKSIGARLAKVSHRKNLVYRFYVVDSDQINAFALPGGYIYVTRGLLAYLNSEAELAAVIGHEIGHVTARHSVRRYTTHHAANVGTTIGSILFPELRTSGVRESVGFLSDILLTGYGREQELEADRLGTNYLARANYDPKAMREVILMLKAHEDFENERAKTENRRPKIHHGLFASHPDNDTRLEQVATAISRLATTPATHPPQRTTYLNLLDGLVFGPSPEQGVLRKNRFYHQDLEIMLAFPPDWLVDNLPEQLVAYADQNRALLQVQVRNLTHHESPEKFIGDRLKLHLHGGTSIAGSKLPTYTGIAYTKTPYGLRNARIIVVFHADKAYVFSGAAEADANRHQYDPKFLNTALSLRTLDVSDQKLAEGLKLSIVTAEVGTTYDSLATSSQISLYPLQQLRLLNGHFPNGQPQPGQQIKIVK